LDAPVAQRLRIRTSGPAVRVAGANVSFSVPHTSLSTGYHYINMISEMIRALHQREGRGTFTPPLHLHIGPCHSVTDGLSTSQRRSILFSSRPSFPNAKHRGQGHQEDGQGQRDKGCRPQASTSCGTQLYSLSIYTTPPLIARACH